MPNLSGTTLIEILISLLLISLLLLGVDVMQIVSLRQTQANYYVTVAEQQMNNMLERLTINPHADLETWNKQNREVLPEGRGVINHDELAIYWGNISEQNCATNKM